MIYHVLTNVVNDEVSMRFQVAGLKVEVASYKPSNYNMIKKTIPEHEVRRTVSNRSGGLA